MSSLHNIYSCYCLLDLNATCHWVCQTATIIRTANRARSDVNIETRRT